MDFQKTKKEQRQKQKEMEEKEKREGIDFRTPGESKRLERKPLGEIWIYLTMANNESS